MKTTGICKNCEWWNLVKPGSDFGHCAVFVGPPTKADHDCGGGFEERRLPFRLHQEVIVTTDAGEFEGVVVGYGIAPTSDTMLYHVNGRDIETRTSVRCMRSKES